MLGGDPWSVTLEDARADASAWLVAGFSELGAPFKGGVLVPDVDLLVGPLSTGPTGAFELATTWPAGVPIVVKNTFRPEVAGTWISREGRRRSVAA